jgi:hypothetical protein
MRYDAQNAKNNTQNLENSRENKRIFKRNMWDMWRLEEKVI